MKQKNFYSQIQGYLGAYGYPTRTIKNSTELLEAATLIYEIPAGHPCRISLSLMATRLHDMGRAERRRLAHKNIVRVEKPQKSALTGHDYALPTVDEIAEHCLGRSPSDEEIHGEIRADDVVIRYTCIRPTVTKAVIDQLTAPEDWL